MDVEQLFCLFHGDAGPMAVPVESVARVLETESLVPLVWSPPQVLGLCPFRRDAVPVISLLPTGNGFDTEREDQAGSPTAASAARAPAEDDDEKKTRCMVVILRTEHGDWGLRIDHTGAFISKECAHFHPLRIDDHGAVFIGDIPRAEAHYTILDPEATWRGLRSAVARWYELINRSRA
jgi:hypothetical protein